MLDTLKLAFDWLISQFWYVLGALVKGLLELIPAPEFVDSAISFLETAAEYLSYPMWLVGFDAGLPMIVTATLIRFTIRRLPVVG